MVKRLYVLCSGDFISYGPLLRALPGMFKIMPKARLFCSTLKSRQRPVAAGKLIIYFMFVSHLLAAMQSVTGQHNESFMAEFCDFQRKQELTKCTFFGFCSFITPILFLVTV